MGERAHWVSAGLVAIALGVGCSSSGGADAGGDAGHTDAGGDASASEGGHDAGTSDGGHDGGTTDAGHDAGTTDASGDAATSDAGTPDAGDVDGGAVGGFPDSWVFVSETRSAAFTGAGTNAAFVSAFDNLVSMRIGVAGECALFDASPGFSGTRSGGTVNITGTAVPIRLDPTILDPSTTMYDSGAVLPATIFSEGDTITFTSTGAMVPAFSGTVTAPALVAGSVFPTSVSRSAPVDVTWTAGTGTAVWVEVYSAFAVGAYLYCVVPTGDSGSYTIPAAALALLPSGDTLANIGIARLNITRVVAGTHPVDLAAITYAFSGNVPLGP